MNSFLDLYTSSDYRVNQRDYHLSTWEYTNGASDTIVPFQWIAPASDSVFAIYKVDIEDNETDITGKFYGGTTLVTGWTETGGTWTVASDSIVISATDVDDGDLITSNQFTLTSGRNVRVIVNTDDFSGNEWDLRIEKDGTPVYTKSGWAGWDGLVNFPCTVTDSDYTVVIEGTDDDLTVSSTAISAFQSRIINSGLYTWYDGGALTATAGNFTDIYRLKLTHGASTFYSDWIDPCGYSGKAKIEISSSYDYGGIKYAGGYEQWMYKVATVRRSPKAEIEILGDKLNGERKNEKITSTVKYTMRMKVTEAEWEALVHGIGGTIEITDHVGKVYDAQNVELSDPAWHNGNAVAELSFIDGNNISVFTRNNTAL